MATRKKTAAAPTPANMTKPASGPQASRISVSPDELKERFAPQRIPLATDFANLIDMADAGCRAAGQASDQDGNAGAGLALDNGRLEVNAGDGLVVTGDQVQVQAKTDAGIVVDNTGVGVQIDTASGAKVGSAGIGINYGNGLLASSTQLRVREKLNSGIVVDSAGIGAVVNNASGMTLNASGIGINYGYGITATANQLRAQVRSNGGITADSSGIGINVGTGLEIVNNQLRGNVSQTWLKLLGEAYGATYYANSSYYSAFASYNSSSGIWFVTLVPKGGWIPYISYDNSGYVNDSRISQYTGYATLRSNTQRDEKLVLYLMSPTAISSGTRMTISVQSNNTDVRPTTYFYQL